MPKIPVLKSNDQSFKSHNKPSNYRSYVQIDEVVNKYVDNCKIFHDLPNLPGLSLYLGFYSLKDMADWFEKNKRFQRCLSRARTVLEHIGIQRMTDPSNKNGNGSHRYMSKVFGYNDKLDIDTTVTTKVIRLPTKKPVGAPVKKPVRLQKKGQKKS